MTDSLVIFLHGVGSSGDDIGGRGPAQRLLAEMLA